MAGWAVKLDPLKSSHVTAAGFADGKLRVQFHNGRIYEREASAEEHAALTGAESPGSHFSKTWRGKDGWTEVKGEPNGGTEEKE